MAGFPTGRVVQNATFIGFRGNRGLAFQEWDNRFFFNEPHGTIGFVIVPPWSAADVEIGTHTIPGGFTIMLWIVQYQNPPTQHYWTCRYNASLGIGLSRWEFAAAASGSEEIAYHDDPAFKPERFEPRGVVARWTSGAEGELGLGPNTMDIFIGTLTAEMSKGVSIQLGSRPTPIADGGRMQWNTLGARLSSIFGTADVLPTQRIVGWWNEQRTRFI